MAITYQGLGTAALNSVAATTLAVPFVASPLADDYFLMFVAHNTAAASTLPAGWTSLFSTNSGGSSPSLQVFGKKATGSESGSQNVTTPNTTSQGRMFMARGVDTTNPIDVGATVASNSTAVAVDVPTLTTTMVGVMLFGFATANASTGTWTPPSGPAAFTEVHDTTSTPKSTAAYLIWAGSGATGTMTFTPSTLIRDCGGVVALRPAVPVASLVIPRTTDRGLILRPRRRMPA